MTASISSTSKTSLDPTHFTPSKSFRNETASLGSKALIDKLIQRNGQIVYVSLRNTDLVSRIGPMKSGQLLKSAILEDEASNSSAFESSSEWNAFSERVPLLLQDFDLEVERGYRIPSLPRIRDPWLRALAWEVNQIGLSGKGLFVNDIEDYMVEDNHVSIFRLPKSLGQSLQLLMFCSSSLFSETRARWRWITLCPSSNHSIRCFPGFESCLEL